MNSSSTDRGILRNAVHHFVSGFCGVVLGITPPPENKEIHFVAGLLAALGVIACALVAIAWFLFEMIARH